MAPIASVKCQGIIQGCAMKYPCRNTATRVRLCYDGDPVLACGMHDRSDPSYGWSERPPLNVIPKVFLPKYREGLRKLIDSLVDDRDEIQQTINTNLALAERLDELMQERPAA